jgi:hypothetical protein
LVLSGVLTPLFDTPTHGMVLRNAALLQAEEYRQKKLAKKAAWEAAYASGGAAAAAAAAASGGGGSDVEDDGGEPGRGGIWCWPWSSVSKAGQQGWVWSR